MNLEELVALVIRSDPSLITDKYVQKLLDTVYFDSSSRTDDLVLDTLELPEMVRIPAGAFNMGSSPEEPRRFRDEGPLHEVRLDPFLMSKYPITQKQWQAVAALPKVTRDLESNPSHFKGINHPVDSVSWFDAVEFCDRLSKYTGRAFRLPTEAQWEYACRAGTTTSYNFGNNINTDLANYKGSEFRGKTTPIGNFRPNAFGLYDMHGNVLEWCLDSWHNNYEDAPVDGSAWITDGGSEYKVMRGGSWLNNPGCCRSAYRYWYRPDLRDFDFGFRVVCEV